ncbi:MAG TPA: tetratricopeptide repeat protein [Jatrophihabitans sp.]|nr:tetratricopeptide repeat protein [Jatrophihabitans sp.]
MTQPGQLVRRARLIVEASPAAAMQLLTPYLASEPDDPMALCVAAQALLKLSRPDQAWQLARRATTLNPRDDWPLRLQTLACHELHRHWDAQELARRSVAVNPSNWQTHYLVGCADLWAERVSEHSAAAAAKARELAPAEPRTHELVGQIALARGRSREAIACFQQALRLDPDNAVAQHELARSELRRGRLGRALVGLRAAGRLDPRLHQVRVNLHNVVIRMVQVLHYMLMLACFGSVASAPIAGGLLLVAMVATGAWAWSRGGRPLVLVVRAVPRNDPLLAVWACCLLTGSLVLFLRAILTVGKPVGTSAASPLIGVVVALLAAGVVSTWLRGMRPPHPDQWQR